MANTMMSQIEADHAAALGRSWREGYAAGLEAAAKACEKCDAEFDGDWAEDDLMAVRCAAAIRALADAGKGE